jgi:hypothetical protein
MNDNKIPVIYKGLPCQYGHGVLRYTIGGSCVECKKQKAKKYNADGARKLLYKRPKQHRDRLEYNRKRYLENREKIIARNKLWYEAVKSNPEYKRKACERAKKWQAKKRLDKSYRQRVYRKAVYYDHGIKESDYMALLEKQGYACKICGTLHVDENLKRLFIDHCHTTEKIRGLLCVNCNLGLGSFKDNASMLRLAAKYLDEFNGEQT